MPRILCGRSRRSHRDSLAGQHGHDHLIEAQEVESVLDRGEWVVRADDSHYFHARGLRETGKGRIEPAMRLRHAVIRRIDDPVKAMR